MENKQNRIESEIEITQKRAKELLRQNRTLQDEQRELELDIKVSILITVETPNKGLHFLEMGLIKDFSNSLLFAIFSI